MLWYNVILYRIDMIWKDRKQSITQSNVLRCDTVRYEIVCYNTRYDMLHYFTIWYVMICYEMIRYDVIQYDTLRYDTIRCDIKGCYTNALTIDVMWDDTAQIPDNMWATCFVLHRMVLLCMHVSPYVHFVFCLLAAEPGDQPSRWQISGQFLQVAEVHPVPSRRRQQHSWEWDGSPWQRRPNHPVSVTSRLSACVSCFIRLLLSL